MNDESQSQADELESLLAVRQAGQGEISLHSLAPAEAEIAEALLELADDLSIDSSFADRLEARLRAQAVPSHSGNKHAQFVRRRWAIRAAVAAIILLATLLTIPPVRASIVEILHLGSVRIHLTQPTPAPKGQATPPLITSLTNLAGKTTFAQAQRGADFPLRLPTYPAALEPPQLVFLQDLGGPAVIFVWTDPQRPDQAQMSLQELSSNAFVDKSRPTIIQQTTVHGQPALWTDGPYFLQYTDGAVSQTRLITGHVLIWTEGQITYRLEVDVPLAEAIRIAESLR